MRLATIDLGTNTARLLIAELRQGKLAEIDRKLLITRLGYGLQKHSTLSVAGKKATLQAVKTFMQLLKQYEVSRTYIFGTSAMREARDGKIFARELAGISGIPVEILSPETEAYYSFLGVTKSLPLAEQSLVFDLGGGSCELIWQEQSGIKIKSWRIGALYLTDTYFQHDPPTLVEIENVRRLLRSCFQELPHGERMIGVGGTVTSLAAMALELKVYDPQKVHGYVLAAQKIQHLLAKMLHVPTKERAKQFSLEKKRALILPAGALVVIELLAAAGMTEVIASEGDLLLGRLYAAISSA
ncbi:MAG: hypothetical protein GX197_10215 [Firmicutes bacterium]|nr:hypothetical protein [Bacillota bacterium]